MKKRNNRTLDGARQALAIARVELVAPEHVVVLGADDWVAFERSLDKPPKPNKRLKELMARRPPWEK